MTFDEGGSTAHAREEDGAFIADASYGASVSTTSSSNCLDFQTGSGSTNLPVPKETASVFIKIRKKTGTGPWKTHWADIRIS